MKVLIRRGMLGMVSLALGAGLACAAGAWASQAGPGDKCPVCGMFVAKYPGFATRIRFVDGAVVHFDGAKDLFTYYFNLKRYASGRKAENIAAIWVTNYYDVKPVEARSAWFVAGSDVFGPMGKELIPFAKESEAREFLKDHKGKAVLRFREVTPAVLRSLE